MPERERHLAPATPIDVLAQATWDAQGIEPAAPCSDEVFVRRVFIDLTGRLPDEREVRAFLGDRRINKRSILIDSLMDREEFADYWALKWCDALRVKAEFPINLWPNAVQAYHRWIRDAVRENEPYDEFARELLTSSGSNFRVPPVNFYRAVQGHEPSTIAEAVALTFMGTRLDGWTPERRAGFEAFFSRLAFKPTGEWKEEIVFPDPAPATPFTGVLPDGRRVDLPPDADPRAAFADWLIDADNPWFARNVVNRIWFWLLGRGLIHEPDDIGPGNPAVHPEVLDYLETELIKSGYDLRHIYRLILDSRLYQQSSIPANDDPRAAELFACYPARRLDAEVLVDALNWIFAGSEDYSSRIPEPFTFIPLDHRTVQLADGSISSQFLEMFGRPTRDTGLASERNNEPTDAQRLHLLNSTHIQKKIERSWWLAGVARSARGDRRGVVTAVYLRILSRPPTPDELAAVAEYAQNGTLGPRDVANDLAWALVNTKEFLYRH
jgi:hypothetical protein